MNGWTEAQSGGSTAEIPRSHDEQSQMLVHTDTELTKLVPSTMSVTSNGDSLWSRGLRESRVMGANDK